MEKGLFLFSLFLVGGNGCYGFWGLEGEEKEERIGKLFKKRYYG